MIYINLQTKEKFQLSPKLLFFEICLVVPFLIQQIDENICFKKYSENVRKMQKYNLTINIFIINGVF